MHSLLPTKATAPPIEIHTTNWQKACTPRYRWTERRTTAHSIESNLTSQQIEVNFITLININVTKSQTLKALRQCNRSSKLKKLL